MYFDLIKSNLHSLSIQTEALELCGWDEDLLRQQNQLVEEFFTNLDLSGITCWEDAKTEIKLHLKNILLEGLDDIFIKLIIHEKTEMTKLMSLEVH